ncbi:MAG: methyltransferase MtaB domain-containing protein [Desulfomonilaceae bacterium]
MFVGKRAAQRTIGKALVDNNESLYSREKAAEIKCRRALNLSDPKLKLTTFKLESPEDHMKDTKALPDRGSEFYRHVS